MNIIPKNKYLLIEMVEEPKEEEVTILLPDDYHASLSKEYELVRILASATESADYLPSYKQGQYALVEGHMVKNVPVLGENFHLVQENYVIAVVGDIEV
jgi:co-chaperonin GroES (HSP10)